MLMIDLNRDPLDEVKIAKRWALAGTLGSVFALVPIYGLVLGLSIEGIAFVLAPAAITSLAGIELTSRWEHGMHRRYAYPHQLGCELAAVLDFSRACQRGVDVVAHWLQANAAVVSWLNEDEDALVPVASYGFPSGWTGEPLAIPLEDESLAAVFHEGHIVQTRPGAASDSWFHESFAGDSITYVPLVSSNRAQGILTLITTRRHPQVRDEPLLAALGLVMALALENCRLYEGQRAHAKHLQELNRMKSDFLSTVSHELRTPLTSIMMAAEMLLEEEETRDPESVRGKLVRNIVKGASRLTSLVSDLVDVSRNDEFRPRLELDPMPITDFVTNAVGVIQPLIAAKRQTLDVTLEDDEVIVRIDRLRMEQVLINLLSNAQRYSPPGGHIVLTSRNEDGEIILSVTDSGPGVAPEDREAIFEPFHRGDRSGLGLGLAIAKGLVELHNGRIWVAESDRSSGSCFCVALPAQIRRGDTAAAEPSIGVSR